MDVFFGNNIVRKPEWTSFGRQRPKREDTIKIDAQKVKCVSAHKIKVGSCSWRGGGRSLWNKTMDLSAS